MDKTGYLLIVVWVLSFLPLDSRFFEHLCPTRCEAPHLKQQEKSKSWIQIVDLGRQRSVH
jgi:hypothetical protein